MLGPLLESKEYEIKYSRRTDVYVELEKELTWLIYGVPIFLYVFMQIPGLMEHFMEQKLIKS